MSSPEVGLAGQYLTRVHQLATQAQAGQNVDTELNAVVNEAIDHFAIIFNPAATLEYFISQLKFNADLVHESQPIHAEALTRAATIAARASTEPDA